MKEQIDSVYCYSNLRKTSSVQMQRILFITTILFFTFYSCSSSDKEAVVKKQKISMAENSKMKIEVWSDVMCPFCYIGKRNYEEALKQFAHSNDIELVWKSYQLDPNIPKTLDKKVTVYEYLAQRKGISVEQSKQMHNNVLQMAKEAGLNYNFEKAIVSNSFDVHKIIQFAKTVQLADEAEERFFKAYFIEGKDLANKNTLIELGAEIGLNEEQINLALTNSSYEMLVNHDIAEADSIGVSGVPFFVFDRKYAVSGAQEPAVFLQTLQKAHKDWLQNK